MSSGEVAQKACLLEGLTQLLAVTPGEFAVVLHSDPDCANLVWRDFRAVDPTRFTCTNLTEPEVLAGTSAGVLEEAIREAASSRDRSCVIVIGSCVSSMLADDVERIAASVASDLPIPVVPIDAHAFRLHGQARILDLYSWLMWRMGERGSRARERGVNLLGFEDDGGESARLLGRMGVDVAAAPAVGDAPEAWGALADGALNVTTDERLFARLIGQMREQRGVSNVQVAPPFGLGPSSAFYETIVERFHLGDEARRAVHDAAAPAAAALEKARRRLAGTRLGFHVAGRKDFSLPVVVREGLSTVDMLLEMGFEVHLLFQGAVEGRARERVDAMLARAGVDLPVTGLPDRVSLGRAVRELGLDAVHCSASLREEVARAGVVLIPLGVLRPGFGGLAASVERLLSSLPAGGRT
jgi:nitrogenase molybdenum-iron protein alpha/beta subunit